MGVFSMLVRERIEELEYQQMSSLAAKSRAAIRRRSEEPCPFRTNFQRDRDRIIHSKAFRRLKHKTQVYIAPGDHYRMRMTHSLEVAQISRTIARGLLLNEDLTEAIALGHDVGHTPFGHAGEYALRDIIGHFYHNEQSLRVVEFIERDGQGLNLTEQVKNGILNHTGNMLPDTLEAKIVRIGDRIAYLCHDFDDSMRAGMINVDNLPNKVSTVLGTRPSLMITAMVSDIITSSEGKNDIYISSIVQEAMSEFRNFMFKTVYYSAILEPERSKAQYVIHKLFDYYIANHSCLPHEYITRIDKWGLTTVVADYIAGLTDVYAIQLFNNLFIPKFWTI